MEGQASHSHRAIFSQPSALVLPLTSPSSSSFLSLRPGWRSVVHLVGTPAVRCCKDSTQQVRACVSDCWDCFTMPLLMKPGQLSDLCPLFWPETEQEWICACVKWMFVSWCRWGAVMWVQMASSEELSRLLVSSVQSLSLQFSQSTLVDKIAFLWFLMDTALKSRHY